MNSPIGLAALRRSGAAKKLFFALSVLGLFGIAAPARAQQVKTKCPNNEYPLFQTVDNADGRFVQPFCIDTSGNVDMNGASPSGKAALKPATTDAIEHVSANGADTNDGQSWGTAKATIGGACAALPGGASSCATGTGIIRVSKSYAGANPTTLSDGITVFDYRYQGTFPAAANNIGGVWININGEPEAAIAGLSATSVRTSPSTTASAILGTNQVTGTIPAGATMTGITGELDVVGSVTPSSGTWVGGESYLAVRSTGGTQGLAWGHTSSVNLDRSTSTTNLTTGGAFDAAPCTNVSTTATVTNCYGFYGEAQTAATGRNYSVFAATGHGTGTNYGSILLGNDTTNGAAIDVQDTGGTPRRLLYEDTSNNIHLQMNNAGFVDIDASDGSTRFKVASTAVTSANPISFFGCCGDAHTATLDHTALTANQTYTFPNTTGTIALAIASGTAAMTTAAIAAGACGTAVSVAATGVATTDTISWSFVTNVPLAANPGELVVVNWPTAAAVNFEYCNPTAASVTPNAATLNWRVVR